MIRFITEHRDHQVPGPDGGIGLRWGVEPMCAVLSDPDPQVVRRGAPDLVVVGCAERCLVEGRATDPGVAPGGGSEHVKAVETVEF